MSVKCLQNEERTLICNPRTSGGARNVADIESLVYCCPCKAIKYCYHLVFNISFLTSFHHLVPEKVGNLEANSDGSSRSLVVSWSPPAGDWDQYRILLFNDSSVLLNISLGKEETYYVIDGMGLIPGRQYEVEVTVESGNLKNSKHCQGRTGKQILRNLNLFLLFFFYQVTQVTVNVVPWCFLNLRYYRLAD